MQPFQLYKKKALMERILASPLAKKIASDKGIQLNQVKGSGENGRIIKAISKTLNQLQLYRTSSCYANRNSC
jgi:pyruvate/2-oxoglutarate dehydrogenase complex dihydrolipoamide acyltransferase (E2) component